MYSLTLRCSPEEIEWLSGELWETGTAGIHEIESGEGIHMIAAFETNEKRAELLSLFASHAPKWASEEATDWVTETKRAWPAREIGERILLAPPWHEGQPPNGRVVVLHNPGLACGTGEHPCTQLALVALEERIWPGARVVDVGTGSGILAIAALRLGAGVAIGLDTDEAALRAAGGNFELNGLTPVLAAGSADCAADECSDITVANISGTVLVAIAGELLRITARHGCLILTGFTDNESRAMETCFPGGEISARNEWRCLSVKFAS